MWKSQVYGKLFELPTHLWISLREIHFPTFSFWLKDYLKSNVRKILDTTFWQMAPDGDDMEMIGRLPARHVLDALQHDFAADAPRAGSRATA